MNHPFTINWNDVNNCKLCGYNKQSHTNEAICENCSAMGDCDFFPNTSLAELKSTKKILLCKKCIQAEMDASIKVMNEDVSTIGDIRANEVRVRMMQDVIECRQQYFNAEIQSINSKRAEILADSSIEDKDKNDKLAEWLVARNTQMREALWGINEKSTEISNQIRANITFMNDFAQHLRSETRERLKIANINYNPGPTKPIKDIKLPTVKLSKEEKMARDLSGLLKISIEEARMSLTGKRDKV